MKANLNTPMKSPEQRYEQVMSKRLHEILRRKVSHSKSSVRPRSWKQERCTTPTDIAQDITHGGVISHGETNNFCWDFSEIYLIGLILLTME